MDIQAALGLVQLERLEYIIRRRRAIAQTYSSKFKAHDLILPPAETGHIYFRYVLGLNNTSTLWIQALSQMGITCDRPIHLPLHRHLNLQGYPATEKAWRKSISIPIYPTLTDEEISRVVDGVATCCEKFEESE